MKVEPKNNTVVIKNEEHIGPRSGRAAVYGTLATAFGLAAKWTYDLNKCLYVDLNVKPANAFMDHCSGFTGSIAEYVPGVEKIPVSSGVAGIFAAIGAGFAIATICNLMPRKIVKIETKNLEAV